ncbi:putative membrane protein [Vibrio cholerae HE-45]|nr:putative membrane protein [Vibrio cholerae HE-45]
MGIPALSYCAFVFSEFQLHYSVYTIKVMSALGLSAALISLLIIF